MEKQFASLKRIQSAMHKAEDLFLCAILTIMIFLAFGQIVARNFFNTGFIWGDALLRNLVLWVGLFGAAVTTRQDRHITVDIASRFLPKRWNAGARVATDAFAATVTGALAWAGWRFVRDEMSSGSMAFESVPSWVMEAAIPVACGIMALRFAFSSLKHLALAVKPSADESAPEGEAS